MTKVTIVIVLVLEKAGDGDEAPSHCSFKKSIYNLSLPICYWLLTICYWLFEGKTLVHH